MLLAAGEVKSAQGVADREVLISGKTMGTTYHVKVVSNDSFDHDRLRAQIEDRLHQVNQSMSTYIPESEISRFNAQANTQVPFKISTSFFEVIKIADEIYRLTGGAWDGTVAPLVNIWGFGALSKKCMVPDTEEIKRRMLNVGFDRIEMVPPSAIRKKRPQVMLDLASIAKGYGVDQVAAVISGNGFRNYLVEIGGEICTSGHRQDGNDWLVGVNVPQYNGPVDAVYKAIPLKNQAMATSGDYRNFFREKGKIYSHIIDPRTGYPVQTRVASVSVKADTCVFADGLATAIMVMGESQGIALVNRLDRVECLIVVRQPNGAFKEFATDGFETEN